jgi:hypothetical protein
MKRKGIPSLEEMATVFATEEAAFQYLFVENVLTVPPARRVVGCACKRDVPGNITARQISIIKVWYVPQIRLFEHT